MTLLILPAAPGAPEAPMVAAPNAHARPAAVRAVVVGVIRPAAIVIRIGDAIAKAEARPPAAATPVTATVMMMLRQCRAWRQRHGAGHQKQRRENLCELGHTYSS